MLRRGGREAQQQRGALSVTEGALVNIRFGLVTTQKSRRRLGVGKFAKVSELDGRESSFPGRRAEPGEPTETSVPAEQPHRADTPPRDGVCQRS